MSWNMTTPYSRHRRLNAYQVTKATVHVVPASVSHTLPLIIPGCSLLQDSSLIELNQKAPLMSLLLKQTEGSLKHLRVHLRKEKHEVWHPSYKMDLRVRKSTFWYLVVICYDWNSLHRTYNFTVNMSLYSKQQKLGVEKWNKTPPFLFLHSKAGDSKGLRSADVETCISCTLGWHLGSSRWSL